MIPSPNFDVQSMNVCFLFQHLKGIAAQLFLIKASLIHFETYLTLSDVACLLFMEWEWLKHKHSTISRFFINSDVILPKFQALYMQGNTDLV